MKTVFITIFQGAEAKNILRTDIYKNLIARDDVRIVFFVDSSERAEYYKKEFSHPRVFYEAIENTNPRGLDAFFSSLSFTLLRTATTDLRRKMNLEDNRNHLGYYWHLLLNRVLARRWVRKLVRALDYLLVSNHRFASYFEKYKPDVVFLAHLFDGQEIHLLREAKHRGVRSIGFINSWDKLTARRALRLLPDSLVVFNEIVKEEAMRYADIKEKNIFVSGIPNYDWHVNYKPVSRGEFCQKNKLDSAKKLIVYAPMGKAFSNSDWDIIDLIQDSTTNNSIANAQLFVRFQPNDFIENEELEKRPWLRYAMPGVRFSRDKPVINIDFEIKEGPISKSPTFFYKTEHYRKVVESGAIQYPKSKEDFLLWINKYLVNPAIDREARKKLVSDQCWKLDGKSGSRIAGHILSFD